MTYFIDTTDKRTTILKELLDNIGKKTNFFSKNSINLINNGDIIVFSPAKKLSIEDVMNMHNDIKIVCGNVCDDIIDLFKKKNIDYKNIMLDEEFTVKNANLTAEGVLALVLQHSEKSIFQSNILLLGNGRISSALAVIFGKLGVKFSIVAYDIKKVPKFYIYTETVFHGDNFLKHVNEYDIIINTIPSKIISNENLKLLPKHCLFIETASIPCLDKQLVENFQYIEAPGLPQRFSAHSAAMLMKNYILGEEK